MKIYCKENMHIGWLALAWVHALHRCRCHAGSAGHKDAGLHNAHFSQDHTCLTLLSMHTGASVYAGVRMLQAPTREAPVACMWYAFALCQLSCLHVCSSQIHPSGYHSVV